MISLSPVPRGLAEIIDVYGNPDQNGDFILDPEWFRENIVKVTAPYPMRLSWRPETVIHEIQCHKSVAGSLLDALTEIRDYKGEAYLYDKHYDYWGGCFNFRQMRGYPALSVHSWGAAVDICPQIGRYGYVNDALAFPPIIVRAFEARGWSWGGRWRAPWVPDAMHFQAVFGY